MYSKERQKPVNKTFQLNEKDLRCRNLCGFYGNPEWDGYCSQCFRQHQKLHEQAKLKNKTTPKTQQTSTESVTTVKKSAAAPVPSSFERFLSKKKNQSQRNNRTFKSVFTPSAPSAKDTDSQQVKPSKQTSIEVQEVVTAFNDFLLTLPKPVAQEIASKVQSIGNKILEQSAADHPIDELSKSVNNFYDEFTDRLNHHEYFSGSSEDVVNKILDFSESYILVRSYKHLFCPTTTDDEDKDLILQSRIRKLNWVTAVRLGATVDEMNPKVSDEMDAAITDIIEIDTKKTIQAKLSSVVSFCRHIAGMLQQSGSGPPSADEYLPAVIFVVLRANPPRLQSNIKFITRFANPNHLRTGEAGYFFTNLCCAVSFIEMMDAKSLDMSEEEFQLYMSGESVTSALQEKQAFMSDGLRQLNKNYLLLSDLRTRQAKLVENLETSHRSNMEFWESCDKELHDCQERYPLTVLPRRRIPETGFDGKIEDLPLSLPPPLIPLPSEDDLTKRTAGLTLDPFAPLVDLSD